MEGGSSPTWQPEVKAVTPEGGRRSEGKSHRDEVMVYRYTSVEAVDTKKGPGVQSRPP